MEILKFAVHIMGRLHDCIQPLTARRSAELGLLEKGDCDD
jgi:hypothetical protein